jgi:phosphoserine phosphatase RsbU/P
VAQPAVTSVEGMRGVADEAFERITRAASRLLGLPVAVVPLVDPAWERRAASEPLVVADAHEEPLPPGVALGAAAYAAVPVFAGELPIGALCVIADRPHRWSPSELELLRDLAAMAQAQLDLREGTRAAQVEQETAEREQVGAQESADVLRRLVDLMDAARAAESLDALLDEIVHTAAHSLGTAAATIALLGDDGRLQVRAVAGVPATEVGDVLLPGSSLAAQVLEEQRVVALADLETAGKPGSGLRGLGLASALAAPLRVDHRSIGVIVVADRAPRAWSELESQLLRLAAERLAISIERARVADQARDIADRLQAALEPSRLPQISGVRLAARYRPAEGRIGGDWYDVFALAGGRAGLAIGDVVGHGIQAAAAAVRLRHALRGLLLRGMRPGEALRELDHLVADEPDAAYSSVLYAEIDPVARTARWASAGHLPAVLLRGGTATSLDSPGGSLLGVTALDPWPERTLALRPGDRLVLYTDGLVERPGVPIDQDIAAVFATVAAEVDLERLCHRLIAARRAPGRDDVAVLAAGVG